MILFYNSLHPKIETTADPLDKIEPHGYGKTAQTTSGITRSEVLDSNIIIV